MAQDQTPEETQEQETQEEETQEEEEEESQEQEEESDDSEESEDDTDWQAEAQKWKRIATKGRKKKETPRRINNQASDERIERLELRQDGYSDKVIDQIMELGGKEALKNDIVKNAVSSMVEQEKSETASDVDGASQSTVRTGVSFDELKGMSSKEMEKHLPKT